MANSAYARIKSKQFEKAGKLTKEEREKRKQAKEGSEGSQVGPLVLAFLLFIVVGSALVQIFNNARTGSIE
ncbi:hypothetical protein ABK040_012942 [Willaertia magna]